MKVNNLPEYAKSKAYIVYRKVSGEAWFYGAWDSALTAAVAAGEISNGDFIRSEEVDDEGA